jgi:hypothetical protein
MVQRKIVGILIKIKKLVNGNIGIRAVIMRKLGFLKMI